MTPARTARLTPLQRPIPTSPPQYDHDRGHPERGRPIEIYTLIDVLFVVIGLGLSGWLAVLYLLEGFSLSPTRMLFLVVFWLVLTYVTLPRLHEVLTWIYLPDYFIGRTRTTEGVLSDPINVAFDGTEEELHAAMRRAGWVLAEERTVGSAWRMVVATLLRRSYEAAPVSDLYLMGRRHDFTYQQEVGGTTAKRHHVRFWRTPDDFVLPGGYRADWLAAGTYDRSVGFSFYTLQFTHRIDEDIDVERDYIVDTVRYADPQVQVEVIRDFSTAYHHRNGQGDRLRTDGDLPVVDLAGVLERSDGATAIMLPRHRATGISMMKTRALTSRNRSGAEQPGSRRSGRAERELQGALEDIQDAVEQAADHHLPPPTIILTGLVLALQLLVVSAGWIAAATGRADLGAELGEISALVPDDNTLGVGTLVAVASLVLFLGVLRRVRWAKLALVALLTADATVRLVAVTTGGEALQTSALAAVGTSVLVVMAMTSDASRLWVRTPRLASTETRLDASTG
ncbi:MAG: LssY C-terminal domain-containing protein [Brachybacterium sp.]|nr:LssY C-terminal domain-containing protein [Brachybacterium sp.]